MRDRRTPARRISTAIVVAALLLSGCESTGNWLKGRRTAEPADIVETGGSEANAYLAELQQLVGGDPATQAEIFADAESAATLTPRPSTELRYALVLASPGHPGSDPAQAQTMLRDLLSQTEMLTETEVALATIFLNTAESSVVLGTEARRLRAENTRAATTEDAAIAQRIAQVEAENRQLRQSLDDAESKLEAITSIEQTIREQSGDNDPQ
jgi:hypothetical protein